MGYIKNVPLTEQQQLDKIKGDAERTNLATINAAITLETAARESVDAEIKASVNQLQTALEDEVTLHANNIGNLRQDVTDEIAAERQERILQDSNLQASIDSKFTDLQSAIQAEKQARISEDSAVIKSISDKYDPITNSLSSGLANEITLSASRDETIFSNLSASIQAEKSARETADASLKTAINNEVTLRAQQTASLSSAINNEVTARTNAVNNLQSNLSTAINNEATLRAKNEKSLGDSIEAVYNNINELVNIDEFSPSTTTKDGKSGIVPAPPKLPNTDTKLLLTSDGWEKMADTAIFIGAVPSQNGTLEYNGGTQYPAWINYDENKLQIGGTTSATNAGTYTTTFTPRGLYCWSDGTRTARNAVWTIKPKTVQVPTAAVTSYEYTGDPITIGIANPNSDALNKTGVDTSTSAGNFAVTFSLKSTSNYVFSDGSTSNKVINWSITPKKIAKPTASTTSFTYNGNAQSLNVPNYDATYMTKTGTDTATAAASYSVTFALKDKTNLHWSDNSTANVTISWSIAVLKLAKPTASVTEFEYNGSTKTLSISNYNSNFMTESGTKSQVNAGSYNSIYTLKDKTNSTWSDNSTADVTISWKINRMKLSASQSTFSQSGTLTYTGNSQTPTISGYNSTYHDLSSTTSATAAGAYVAKVAPKSNYAFSDGSTAAKSVNWSIGKKTFNKPTASTTEFEYTGNTITLSVTGYDSTYMNKSGSDTAVAEGDYSVVYSLKDTSNYQWQDSSNAAVTINWKIKTNKITKPTITAGASQEYTGNTLKPTISGYDANKMTVTGTSSAINAAEYTLTYSLRDKANTKWADGSTADVTLTWQITRKKLTAAQSTFSQSGTLTYNGSAQSPTISGYNSAYHDLGSDTSKTAAGSYKITITPKSNYAFSDGSTSAKTCNWSIGKKSLTKPSASVTSFEYDGSTKTLSVSNYNSNLMTQSGTVSSSAKGNYTASYTLNDTANYMWNDSSTAKVDILWSIGAKAIAKPARTDSETFTYDGTAKTITISGYDSNTMTFSGTTSETNAGNFQAVYELKDKNNYVWQDSNDTANVVISWSIARARLSEELSDPTQFSLDITEDAVTGATIYYKYTKKYYFIPDYEFDMSHIKGVNSDYHNCSVGIVNSSNTTKFTASIDVAVNGMTMTSLGKMGGNALPLTAGVAISPKSNYCWIDGTTTSIWFYFQIVQIKIPKPSLPDNSFKYTGSTITPNVLGANLDYLYTTGTTAATNIGSYSITYSFSTTYNGHYYVIWDDGTTDPVTINWEITYGDGITKPTLTKSAVEWSGGNVSPTIANFDSSLMTKSGTDTAVDIGTYSITFALKDKTNTKWADGTTADITLNWQVTRKKLSAAQSTFSQSGTLTYNGNSQTPSIAGYNSNYHDLGSQTSMSNAGTYNITITPKSTYCWSDGTYASKSCNWSIQPLRLTKPTLTNTSYTYDTNAHSPTINNFNPTYEEYSGSDTATNASTYTLNFSLKNSSNTTWQDSTTGTISLNWVINPVKLVKPSLSNTTFTYDGNEHAPTVNNYDSTVESIGGSTIKNTNAGSFNYYFSLKDTSNYQFSDGSTDTVVCTWKINKKTPTLSVSTSSIEMPEGSDGCYYDIITYDGGTTLTVTSADTSIVTPYIRDGQLALGASGYGSVKVTITAPENTNYNSKSVTVTVLARFFPSFYSCPFSQVQAIAKAGKASTAWNVGDERYITSSSSEFNFKRMFILGFGDNYVDCALVTDGYEPMNVTTDTVGLMEQATTSNDPNYKCFVHYREGDTPATTYANSHLIAIENKCVNALPSDLRNIITSRTDLYTSYGGSATPVNQNVSRTLWSLDVQEIIAGRVSGNLKRYQYFQNGNSINADKCYWTRTPSASNNTTNKFYYIRDTSGQLSGTQYGSQNYGVVFGFRIG